MEPPLGRARWLDDSARRAHEALTDQEVADTVGVSRHRSSETSGWTTEGSFWTKSSTPMTTSDQTFRGLTCDGVGHRPMGRAVTRLVYEGVLTRRGCTVRVPPALFDCPRRACHC